MIFFIHIKFVALDMEAIALSFNRQCQSQFYSDCSLLIPSSIF